MALLFRVGIILADTVHPILPSPPISGDHNRYAIEVASAWSSAQFVGLQLETGLMRVFVAHALAPFYLPFGPSEFSGRIGIAVISTIIGLFTYKIANEAVDRRISLLATSLVLFWPTVVYRSVVIQREVIIVVALLAFLWATVQWLDAVTLLSVAVAFCATATIFVLREENFFLLAVMVGFVTLVKSYNRPYYFAGFALLATPFVAYFVFNFAKFTGYGTTLSPAALNSFAYGRAHGDAAYLLGLHYDSWLDVVLYMPMKVLYFLYTPFPWHIRGMTEALVGASALVLLAVTMGVRRGIGMLRDEPHYLGLLLTYLVTGVVAYSIIEMNYGAAVRRRIQFIPILILLAVIGISNVRVKIQEGRADRR